MTITTSTTRGSYAGRRTISAVHNVLLVIAMAALIGGPAFWVNGLTQPLVRVEGPITRGIAVPVPGSPLGVQIGVVSGTSARATIYDESMGSDIHLSRAAKLLWRSDFLVLSLSIAAGAFLLARLTRDVGAGRPFERRNARRIALVAVSVVIGGTLAPILGAFALGSALTDAGLDPGHPLSLSASFDVAPVFGGLALLVLAQAFRIGAQVTEDVEGLV